MTLSAVGLSEVGSQSFPSLGLPLSNTSLLFSRLPLSNTNLLFCPCFITRV